MSLSCKVLFLACLIAWTCDVNANKDCQDVYNEMQDLKKIFYKEISNLNNIVQNQDEEIKRLKTQNAINKQKPTEEPIEKSKRLLLDGTPQTDRQHIAFYAHLSHNIDKLGVNQHIVFDKVRTNQGNAYKAVDGEFVANVAGTYYFVWTISNSDRTYMISEIVVNGVPYNQIISDAAEHTDWAVSTSFTIVQLNIDDRVWIRTGTHHTGHVSGIGYGTSSFAGFFLW